MPKKPHTSKTPQLLATSSRGSTTTSSHLLWAQHLLVEEGQSRVRLLEVRWEGDGKHPSTRLIAYSHEARQATCAIRRHQRVLPRHRTMPVRLLEVFQLPPIETRKRRRLAWQKIVKPTVGQTRGRSSALGLPEKAMMIEGYASRNYKYEITTGRHLRQTPSKPARQLDTESARNS